MTNNQVIIIGRHPVFEDTLKQEAVALSVVSEIEEATSLLASQPYEHPVMMLTDALICPENIEYMLNAHEEKPEVMLLSDHVSNPSIYSLALQHNIKLIDATKPDKFMQLLQQYYHRPALVQDYLHEIIGQSHPIKQAKQLAVKAAESDITVHLEGSSGVGKELFARAIHYHSPRKDHNFVTINCGAIPDNLIESVLFGHVKGAFTGAYQDSSGKFRDAHQGTIFLDEIGELKPEMQVKLLRVLQESEVEPVGGKEKYAIDIRIISATNKDLKLEVSGNRFREDLFYRLNVFPIHIAPLCSRGSDIDAIATHYLWYYANKENKLLYMIDEAALQLLRIYPWPGNIRELQNIMYRSVILAENHELILQAEPIRKLLQEIDSSLHQPVLPSNHNIIHNISTTSDLEQHIVHYIDHTGEVIPMEIITKQLMEAVIHYYGGNISKAADKLKIGRSTLYRKIGDNK